MKTQSASLPTEVTSPLLDALITTSRDGILILNTDGLITFSNKIAERFLQSNPGGLTNIPITDLITDENWQLSSQANRQPSPQPLSLLSGNGSIANYLSTITPIHDNFIEQYLFVFYPSPTHTTDAAKHLEIIFENASESFVLLDRNGIVQAFNNNASSNLLMSRIGARVYPGCSIYDYVDQDRREDFHGLYEQVLMGKNLQYEKDYTNESGEVNWFHFSLTPVLEAGVTTGVCITGTNINERKQAEQELALSHKKFRGLVEHSGDAVVIFSQEGNPTYTSPSLTRILGYNEQHANINLFSLIHPEDLPFVLKVWDKILASPGRTFFNNQCRIRHANGEWRWVDGTLTNLLHDPAIAGIVDNFRDVTELVQSQTEQRLSVDHYRYLFNHNPVPMWIFEPETLRFLEVNDAAVRRYGYSRKEFLTMTLPDIRPPRETDKQDQGLKPRLGKAYSTDGTWIHKTRSGELLDVEISTHHVLHEGTGGVLVLAHDVTERTRAVALLYKSYQEKTNILETVPYGFLRMDHGWTVTYWNKEAERILGLTREDILGKNILQVYPSARSARFYTEAKEALNAREQRVFEEYLEEAKMWIEVTAYPFEDGLSAYFKDITMRKQNEEEVNSLNNTLNTRAEQLARSNEELERFAYVASHDLQEPLRMVSSFLQLLQKNYASQLDEKANRYINFAVDGASRMRKLILDLLTYSQVSNKQEHSAMVDPNQLMEGIIVDYHPRLLQKNVALQIDEFPKVRGNEMQINQLFRNFISNAIKYNNSDKPTIHIGSTDLGNRIEFFVKDNGIGIEQKFMEKVFVIFQRLHQKHEYSGTGIGLAICKKIVELHGGKIRIESTPGQGSTFFFTLLKYEE